MITDSYLHFNGSDFSSKTSQQPKQSHPNQPPTSSTAVPHQSMSYPATSSDNNNNSNSNNSNNNSNYAKPIGTEQDLYDLLRSNNYKQQIQVLDELIAKSQSNDESLLTNFKSLGDFYRSLGSLMLNTSVVEVQRSALKFIQLYMKQVDRLKARGDSSQAAHDTFKRIDANLCDHLLDQLIACSVSSKLPIKQMSIDIIYTCVKLTEMPTSYFDRMAKCGIENGDAGFARAFIDPVLFILINQEFAKYDHYVLVRSLAQQLIAQPKLEAPVMKCLGKIETLLGRDKYQLYLNKLPAQLMYAYANAAKRIQLVRTHISLSL